MFPLPAIHHLAIAWLTEPWARWPVTVAYLTTLTLLSLFGLHRWRMVWRLHRARHKRAAPEPVACDGATLPMITVQVPLYNEANVAERVIDAVCALDWPADRFQVQVLDDSDDAMCLALSRKRVALWAARGVNITWLHRDARRGYKAGALGEALAAAKGAFIAVFDADFVPPPDWLRRVMPHVLLPGVGMAQTRWEHLNRDASLLTCCEAMCLDAHFAIEHASRQAAGRWVHFNGTAGVWRREAIEQAGGWDGDTLSEDVDLSYRSQLAGWRFVYLDDVVAPAELPATMSAFKSQQHRWSKGLVQVAIKLLPRIARADAPLGHKIEAALHLLAPLTHPLMLAMALLLYPAMLVNAQPFAGSAALSALMGATLLALGAGSAGAFYVAGQQALQRGTWSAIARLPLLMALGVGMSINNARGVMEAFFGHRSPFVRTPKAPGSAGGSHQPAPTHRHAFPQGPESLSRTVPRRSRGLWVGVALEMTMAAYLVACAHAAILLPGAAASVPFLLLFSIGFAYVGVATLWPDGARIRQDRRPFGLAAKRQGV